MASVNEDILCLLLDFIDKDTLDSIASVHPIFDNARMTSEYNAVTLYKRDKATKRLIAHLSEDWVGRHVKSVALRPWLVDPRTKSPRSITENVLTRCMEIIDPHYTKKVADHRLQKRLRKDATRVNAAFDAMKNVHECTIEWDGDLKYHPEFYHSFVVPPLEKWSAHLLSLTLCAPPFIFNSLARVRLPRLECLDVKFNTGRSPEESTVYLYDGFVVFANNLKDTLTSLSFSSTSSSLNLDLSRIFKFLGTFPHLRKVALSIPFDGGHLVQPSSFSSFVAKHRSSLKEFVLLTSRCTIRNKSRDPEHVNWIQDILSSFDIPFPLLVKLEIAIRPLRTPIAILRSFLDMHSSTLQSISLMDRVLDIGDLEDLFGPPANICEDMQHLRIKTRTVSPTILACIARLAPRLETCVLEGGSIEAEQPFLSKPGVLPLMAMMAERSTAGIISRNRHALTNWGLQQLIINIPAVHSSRETHRRMDRLKDQLILQLPNLTVNLHVA